MFRPPLCLLFALLVFNSFGQTVILTNEGRVDVGDQLQYWKDETGKLTLEEIKLLELKKSHHTGAPNFGFDRAAYWFKIDVSNHSNDPHWLLEVTYSPLDHVDFYTQEAGGKRIHKISGDTYPISTRDLTHRNPNFRFDIAPQSRQTIYLQVQTISSV